MITSGLLLADGPDALHSIAAGGLFLFLSVLMICIFSFVSIAVWSEARRKEREAYYKAEMVRRIAEAGGESAKYLVEMMREDERLPFDRVWAEQKRLEGMKLGGLITMAVGVALACLIWGTSHAPGSAAVGLIPGLVGFVLFVYAQFLAPRPPAA